MKAMKKSSYIAWLGIAAAEYLDLGLTREQLVYLYRECLEVARFQNDFKLNYYSCITLLPLTYDISAPPCTLEYFEASYKLAKVHGDANLEMIVSLLMATEYKELHRFQDSILYGKRSLNIAKKIGDKSVEKRAYLILLKMNHALDRHDEVIVYGKLCLSLVDPTEDDDRNNETCAYYHLGKAYYSLNQYDEAVFYSRKCLDVYQGVDGTKHLAMEACLQLVYIYQSRNRHEDVIIFGKKSVEMSKQCNDKSVEMEAYLLLCTSYFELKQFNKCLLCTQEAIKAARITCNQEGEMFASLSRARTYLSLGQYDDVIIWGKKCVDLALINILGRNFSATKKVNEEMMSASYLIMADAHLKLEEYEDCILSTKKAVTIAKTLKKRETEEEGYFFLGQAYEALHRYGECILYWEKCIEIAELTNSKNTTMTVRKLLGQMYLDCLKKHHIALLHFKKCLEYAKATGEAFVEMVTNLEIARIYYWFEDVDNAVLHIKKTLTAAAEIGDKTIEAEAYLELGKCYDFTKQYDDAMFFTNKSIDIAKQIGNKNNKIVEINAYLVIARIHNQQGKYDDAITFNDKCNDIAEEIGEQTSEITGHWQMGKTYYDTNRYEEAIFHLNKCIDMANGIDNKYMEMKTWFLLGAIYDKLQKYDEVVRCTKRCISIVLETTETKDKMKALFLLGNAYYALKQTEKAEEPLKESIKCFKFMFFNIGNHDQFKIAFVDKYYHVYELLLKVLIEANKNEEALVLADHFRALALKDILVSNYGMKEETTKGGLQYTDIQKLVSSNNYAILLFSVFLGEIYTFLVEASEEYNFSVRYFKYSDKCFDKIIEKSYTEMKVRQVVNCEDRCLDALFDGEVKGDSPTNIRGPAEEPSEDSEDKSMTNALEIFYRCVLPKLILEATPEEIVIFPDAFLHEVPFAALQDPDTGRYLSETKRIRLAPSIATLKLLSENAGDYHSNEGALIIGDPLVGKVMFNGEEKEFVPLDDAFVEARAVANLFRVTPLTKEAATKSAVIQRLQQGVAVVHIAAHGSLTKGTIALAPSPEIRSTKPIPDEEDYMLTMAEVQQAQVRAQLVVLSCCHSGRGEIRAEGVVGMCRAFLASGARAVVASLWAIDDQATLEFMLEFYFRLIEGKSVSVSLQQAMEEMRECYSEPKYWAPFFLMGDDVTIKL